MSNLSKKDYKKFNKKAIRRKGHQEIDVVKRTVRSSAKRPWWAWQGMSTETLLKMLEDYQLVSVEQNHNWNEEEIIVRFCKPTPVTRVNLEHWF